MAAFIDMAGQRYGRMLVIARAGYLGPHIAWACLCDCGKEKTVRGHHLRNGLIVSCGCRRDEVAGDRFRTHGEGYNRSPEYTAWANMLHRCSESAPEKDRRNYYERGIFVCARWRSYENFLADMGRRPSPAHSIDRENNDGPYEPDNCRWAIMEVQANNRRTNRAVIYRGKVVTLVRAWRMSAMAVPYSTVSARILDGWPADVAIDTPALVPSGKREAGSRHWQRTA